MTDIKTFSKRIFFRGAKRFLPILSTALVLTLVLTACGPIEPAPAGVFVVDDLGRLVAINGTPQRIVSLAPANTEILFALGLGEKMVGVTEFCNYPPEAMDKEKVGGYYPPEIEKIIALGPDLILATDIHRHEVIPALEEQGFTVFALAPQTLDEVLESIQKAGRITGREEQALELVDDIESKIEGIAEQVDDLEERPRVFYITWHDPLWTVGRNTWIDDLIEIAGGVNIFSQYFQSGAMVELEWVISLNPEVIIASQWAFEWANNATELELTDARQNDRVYQSDDDLVQRSGPRLVSALEWFAHFIHPEVFDEPEGS